MKNLMYETMYILRPDITEEVVDAEIAKYQEILQEQGSTILETQHRGKRRLAYEIQNHREGIYIQMNYQGPGHVVAAMERAMRLSESVLRYLTVKQALTEDFSEASGDMPAPEPVEGSSAPPPGAA
ncbi:30S ribosomal protein S6 [Oscillatoria sp. CS-180]|uniref:30S ribosomal protein S6 n=1 Tax=Oscillatoria sp. CS-180 TaxID=3021720 RepID=UPI00232E2151|nr:30S ribosomal protein S6 [Oscillatoria sp. CS-180]MDB9528869.1 30S ribosomal protein S6 [Oscillatoria sp. CS-180]